MSAHGFPCPEFRAPQFGLLKILDEAGDEAACLGRHGVKLVKLCLGHVVFVESGVKLIANFTARAFCITQELDELAIASTLEAFRDVRSDGLRGAPYLILERKVTGEISMVAVFVDSLPQFPALLPSFDVLKSFDARHDSSGARTLNFEH